MSDTLDARWKFVQRESWTFRRGEIVSFLDSGVGGTPAKEVSYGLITKSATTWDDAGAVYGVAVVGGERQTGHIWVLTDRDHRKFSTYWFIEGMQGKILQ